MSTGRGSGRWSGADLFVDKQVRRAPKHLTKRIDSAFPTPKNDKGHVTPHKLAPEVEERFKKLAQENCVRCHGRGFTWKRSGYTAVACKCLQTKMALEEKVLTELKGKVERELERARTEGVPSVQEGATGGREAHSAPAVLQQEVRSDSGPNKAG